MFTLCNIFTVETPWIVKVTNLGHNLMMMVLTVHLTLQTILSITLENDINIYLQRPTLGPLKIF